MGANFWVSLVGYKMVQWLVKDSFAFIGSMYAAALSFFLPHMNLFYSFGSTFAVVGSLR